MAKKGGAKGKDKGPKVKAKHISQVYKTYEVSGNQIKRKNKTCPKCGDGVFMANHKNRSTCGKCGFTEFQK